MSFEEFERILKKAFENPIRTIGIMAALALCTVVVSGLSGFGQHVLESMFLGREKLRIDFRLPRSAGHTYRPANAGTGYLIANNLSRVPITIYDVSFKNSGGSIFVTTPLSKHMGPGELASLTFKFATSKLWAGGLAYNCDADFDFLTGMPTATGDMAAQFFARIHTGGNNVDCVLTLPEPSILPPERDENARNR